MSSIDLDASPSSMPRLLARYDFIVVPEFIWLEAEERPSLDKLEAELVQLLRREIEVQFSNRVAIIFEGQAEVRIERVEQGSIWGTIIIVLGVGIAFYEFVAKYKDFYDSLVLLRHHLDSIIRATLDRIQPWRPRPFYRTYVSLTSTPLLRAESFSRSRESRSMLYRDPLIWYLMITNLAFMIIIGILVYRAVAITYLGTP